MSDTIKNVLEILQLLAEQDKPVDKAFIHNTLYAKNPNRYKFVRGFYGYYSDKVQHYIELAKDWELIKIDYKAITKTSDGYAITITQKGLDLLNEKTNFSKKGENNGNSKT